ncbi:G patch domain-containing protein 4-like [Magallana gigas]|uniref:G patch domain-containing protein 4-like n=1 Tax=Magallana gigas TaxID=29159 RepID=UPI00333F2F62
MSENGDLRSNSKKKKKKKKKKNQKDQHTKSTDVNEGIIAVNSQAENALVENEKSEKIQKKKKKRKRNHPEIDLETLIIDQEQGNTETNQPECNNNQDIQPPSSGNDINGTSFNDERGTTMTENYEKVKKHKKSKKKRANTNTNRKKQQSRALFSKSQQGIKFY